MRAILPSSLAAAQCQVLINILDKSSLGRALNEKGHGRMFGVLVCSDGTVLRAFSGLLEGEYLVSGFVPPAFCIDDYVGILARYDALIKEAEAEGKPSKELSNECWSKLTDLYRFCCFDGKERTLREIWPSAPSGTGDCCAPRLLSYCYHLGLKPASLAEFFYGSGSYEHLSFHNPCDSRCKPLLPAIIGLDIVYQDSDIVVVNKPSGLLAIEGKGPDKQDCIASRVRSFFGQAQGCIQQPCIHRLDQATSGLMVLGLTQKAHDILSSDFENRRVEKRYQALVAGFVAKDSGCVIDLPMRLDVDNRPHQIVDFENGKNAVTEYSVLGYENRYGIKCTRLELRPQTGRTHQLRVHCAYGLGKPIVGDALYDESGFEALREHGADRLMLQAYYLRFKHPITGQDMEFSLPQEF